MKFFKSQSLLVVPALCMMASAYPVYSAVETETVKTFEAAGEALDTTVSGDGKYFYVLFKEGVVGIFPTNGGPKEEIRIEGKADKIAATQSGDALFLTDSETGTTQLVSVSFVQKFDVEGSPFKGPENAPVAIVVFSDFQ